jgi:hypothetical protein
MPELSLTIIIPCHNSTENIAATIKKISMYLPVQGSIEIILVENGSTDNTSDELTRVQSADFNNRIIIAKSDKGLGNALRKGVTLASKDYVLFLADDLPFGMSELTYVCDSTYEIGEYYIFSKYKNRLFLRRSFLRSLSGYVFVFMREILLKTRVLDSQGTFFASNVTAKRIFSDCNQDGYLITTEAILAAKKLGLRVKEIPVNEILPDMRKSNITFRDAQKMFQSLIRLWWESRRS